MPESPHVPAPAPAAPRREVRHYRRLASDSDEAVEALVNALVADLFGDDDSGGAQEPPETPDGAAPGPEAR